MNKPKVSLKFYLQWSNDLKKNFIATVFVNFAGNCLINYEKHSFKRR
jgi:hypothetical protein